MKDVDKTAGVIRLGIWTNFYKNGELSTKGCVCSNCDTWTKKSTPYCPNCGEPMKNAMSGTNCTNVTEFIECSSVDDWINRPTQEVYDIYWQWCIKNSYSPLSKITFMKSVLNRFPGLKSSPMKGKRYFRTC